MAFDGPLRRWRGRRFEWPRMTKAQGWKPSLTWAFAVERVKGIEPSLSPWELALDRRLPLIDRILRV